MWTNNIYSYNNKIQKITKKFNNNKIIYNSKKKKLILKIIQKDKISNFR